jgi:hypothetical protein
VGALAKEEVGKYLDANFVSSFQKVATFRIVGDAKQGGNVASYFCDPDGRVVHAVAGPVDAATLLREARWAVEAYKMGVLESAGDDTRLRSFFQTAHAERLKERPPGLARAGAAAAPLVRQGQVHLLLSAAPLAEVERVYKLVFERILGEKISTAPVAVVR